MQVKVQISKELVTFLLVVPNRRKLYVLMPDKVGSYSRRRQAMSLFRKDLLEDQSEEMLEDVHNAFDSCLQREICCKLLPIDRVLRLKHLLIVVCVIPEIEFCLSWLVSRCKICVLELSQSSNVILSPC